MPPTGIVAVNSPFLLPNPLILKEKLSVAVDRSMVTGPIFKSFTAVEKYLLLESPPFIEWLKTKFALLFLYEGD